ncbi:hypothetical protein RQP46_008082 [Phenoliferia psychrophenolica]
MPSALMLSLGGWTKADIARMEAQDRWVDRMYALENGPKDTVSLPNGKDWEALYLKNAALQKRLAGVERVEERLKSFVSNRDSTISKQKARIEELEASVWFSCRRRENALTSRFAAL